MRKVASGNPHWEVFWLLGKFAKNDVLRSSTWEKCEKSPVGTLIGKFSGYWENLQKMTFCAQVLGKNAKSRQWEPSLGSFLAIWKICKNRRFALKYLGKMRK